MDCLNNTPAERLVAHSFNTHELRILFENQEFRELVGKMKSIDDAERVITFATGIIENRKAPRFEEGPLNISRIPTSANADK
jgi:hypothetical protein